MRIMNRIAVATSLAAALLVASGQQTYAQGTAFTYQGRLSDTGGPANGTYDFRFILYNYGYGGDQVGDVLTNSAVAVAGGLFTTTLDFGGGIFTGTNLWLEIGVHTNGPGSFVTLSPRQPITPTPYAVAAGSLTGTLPASQLNGPLPATLLSGSFQNPLSLSNTANEFAGTFTGNGAGLTNLTAPSLGGYLSAYANSGVGNPPAQATNGVFVTYSTNVAFGTNILFNNVGAASGWSPNPANSGTAFVAANTGVYQVHYEVSTFDNGDPFIVAESPDFAATLNNVEISGSRVCIADGVVSSVITPINAGDALAVQCIAPATVTLSSVGGGYYATLTVVRLQ
jgi:hypothetical protein